MIGGRRKTSLSSHFHFDFHVSPQSYKQKYRTMIHPFHLARCVLCRGFYEFFNTVLGCARCLANGIERRVKFIPTTDSVDMLNYLGTPDKSGTYRLRVIEVQSNANGQVEVVYKINGKVDLNYISRRGQVVEHTLMKFQGFVCRSTTTGYYELITNETVIVQKLITGSRELLNAVLNAMNGPVPRRFEHVWFGFQRIFTVLQQGRYVPALYTVQEHDHAPLKPGHVFFDQKGRIQHSKEQRPPLSEKEAKLVIVQMLDGLFYLSEMIRSRRLVPINIVISDGRIKFVMGKPGVDYHWHIPAISLAAVGVDENIFEDHRYAAPHTPYDHMDDPLDEWITKCVLLVFTLMAPGGIPLYDDRSVPGLIKYDHFVASKFLSTHPDRITWDQLSQELVPGSENYLAAECIHRMSNGMKLLFQAVLFRSQDPYQEIIFPPGRPWNLARVVKSLLDYIFEKGDDGVDELLHQEYLCIEERNAFEDAFQEVLGDLEQMDCDDHQQVVGGEDLEEPAAPLQPRGQLQQDGQHLYNGNHNVDNNFLPKGQGDDDILQYFLNDMDEEGLATIIAQQN